MTCTWCQGWTQYLHQHGLLSLEVSLQRRTASSDRLGLLACHQFAPLLAELVRVSEGREGREALLMPTYSFVSLYLPGGSIGPHTDRPQNQYSVYAPTPPHPDHVC